MLCLRLLRRRCFGDHRLRAPPRSSRSSTIDAFVRWSSAASIYGARRSTLPRPRACSSTSPCCSRPPPTFAIDYAGRTVLGWVDLTEDREAAERVRALVQEALSKAPAAWRSPRWATGAAFGRPRVWLATWHLRDTEAQPGRRI